MIQETVVELQETEKQNSGCSINDARVSESMITIQEDSPDLSCSQEPSVSSVAVNVVRDSENRSADSGESCATGIVGETKVAEDRKEREKSWVVDLKLGDGDICDGEIVCRICHLSSEQPWKFPFFAAKTDLIMLGCGCKGELSVAHSYCGEAWFKLKGNRICEICGEIANNIRGVGNESFMEEWKDGRMNANALDSADRSAEGCWHGQPLCNFLMACLVIAFVLPWFFRFSMF
ncbi:hypothetical protein SOVF_137110 [Spinacia oleracea]|nr:hypothetical protein SOVF_137110 [Spinacia oleracea]